MVLVKNKSLLRVSMDSCRYAESKDLIHPRQNPSYFLPGLAFSICPNNNICKKCDNTGKEHMKSSIIIIIMNDGCNKNKKTNQQLQPVWYDIMKHCTFC